MRRAPRRHFCAALVACVGLASCGVSPTLPPLPPPDEPQTFRQTSAGLVLVEGMIPVDEAKVFILNHQSDRIFGEFVHEGRYAIEVEAVAGDFMQLWYSSGGVESDTVSFELPSELDSETADQ